MECIIIHPVINIIIINIIIIIIIIPPVPPLQPDLNAEVGDPHHSILCHGMGEGASSRRNGLFFL